MLDVEEIGREFLKDEMLDFEVYTKLAARETDRETRDLLKALAKTEEGHVRMWKGILGDEGSDGCRPAFMRLKTLEMIAIRRLLGIAFVVKFLERHEGEDLKLYRRIFSGLSGGKYKKSTEKMISHFMHDERILRKRAESYRGDLDYTQSIIFGLNDGLVEILAVVAGLAMVATTSFIVVILGMIAGISGTLSMAGGAYLSAKSEGLVENGIGEMKKKAGLLPEKEAYYTGVWYFIGALLAVIPFILGIGGLPGVLISILIVCTSLSVVSVVIAIISGTSARRRVFDMLAVSLGAAFVTILFGAFARLYLGVTV